MIFEHLTVRPSKFEDLSMFTRASVTVLSPFSSLEFFSIVKFLLAPFKASITAHMTSNAVATSNCSSLV